MNRLIRTVAAGAVAIALLATGGVAASADDGVDLSAVDPDLQGFVLVAGGEVYDESLEPVATMDEYVEQFEEAGVDIPEEQAEVTETEDRLAPEQTLGLSGAVGSRGTAVGGRLKLEAPGCSGQDRNRSLQRFQRAAKGGAPRGIADLRCGYESGGDGWGWRHIVAGHAGDYNRIASLMGRSWDSYAKWCLGQTLGVPASATYQTQRQTYLYKAPIQVWSNGRLYKTYTNQVAVSRGDFRVITEYFS
ncbi:hypothetical protein [Leifsonia xyli]|uniref:hypothetical protein n=1 Tax=Leifsonia xyli TaxID=1575 RepID=UPI003D67CC70